MHVFDGCRAAALAVLMLGSTITAWAQAAPAAITVTSPTLKASETIPKDHTADGKNLSPALAWSGAPAATKQFALVCDDPDVPMAGGFVHWVIYKIPGAAKGLSGFRRAGYRGPAPPPGKPHHYGPVDLRSQISDCGLIEDLRSKISN
jgi:phosphatidylethanolamine-binding protein (PEBP) family uncharacterized protein